MAGSVCAVLLLANRATATSVRPVGFDELCERAAIIFRGRVAGTSSVERRGTQNDPVIVTEVTFAVEKVLKGTTPSTTTLALPGGRIGNRALRVSGVPTLTVGERLVVFVAPEGSAFVPFVGVGQGVLRIEWDPETGADVIAASDLRRLRRAESRRAGSRNVRDRFAVGSAVLLLSRFEEQIHALVP